MQNNLLNQINDLIHRAETETVEYKQGNSNPERIAQYISALSNSAAINHQNNAFMIWGVADDTNTLTGTNFYPYSAKKGNENLVAWLERVISPKINFEFEETTDENDKHFVLLTIPAATISPVSASGSRYVRSGSSVKKLVEFPNKERLLWQALQSTVFEDEIAQSGLNFSQVDTLLSVDTYFNLLNMPMPSSPEQISGFLIANGILKPEDNDLYSITNLGAIILAKNLNNFPSLRKHAMRVIKYVGVNKVDAESDYTGARGYAVGFQGLLDYVSSKLPKHEAYMGGKVGAKRTEVTDYPAIAIRELVANALVHQDFSISGVSPTIEIFANRVVITNPGRPLIDVNRLMDYPPRSRNDKLATLFRNMNFIEERGSGIDKTIYALESQELPAPRMFENGDFFEVTLFSRRSFDQLTSDERISATYLHASLKRLEDGFLTNASLRKRFGLKDKESSKASKLITQTLESGWIAKFDENTSPKLMKYIPYWAK